jgi:hypothetical protein
MTHLVMLAALAVVPLLAILLLRVNGAIAFMSLCLGSVLVTYTSSDVTDVLGGFSASKNLSTNQWAQVVLLIAPFLLTVLFTRGSVKGAKSITNILPAAATGLLCALLVVPLLPAGLQGQLNTQTAWQQLNNAQTAIILGGALFSLTFLLFTHRRKHEEEGKKRHHKD